MFEHQVTAVITTSPIPSNPSTHIIDETYASIRKHLPDIPILILADGVRNEQQILMAAKYQGYKKSLLEKNWPHVAIREFETFMHQAGMIRIALKEGLITTPLILWVEHDWPICPTPIDWHGIIDTVLSKELSYIRMCHDSDLRYEAQPNIAQQYEKLTGQKQEKFISSYGVPLLKTVSFNSAPHIASTEFYSFLVGHFQKAAIHLDCDPIHEIVENAHTRYSLGVYAPESGDMKRFYNLDGRGAGSVIPPGPKFPMVF